MIPDGFVLRTSAARCLHVISACPCGSCERRGCKSCCRRFGMCHFVNPCTSSDSLHSTLTWLIGKPCRQALESDIHAPACPRPLLIRQLPHQYKFAIRHWSHWVFCQACCSLPMWDTELVQVGNRTSLALHSHFNKTRSGRTLLACRRMLSGDDSTMCSAVRAHVAPRKPP
jgi:hypothetical protein